MDKKQLRENDKTPSNPVSYLTLARLLLYLLLYLYLYYVYHPRKSLLIT